MTLIPSLTKGSAALGALVLALAIAAVSSWMTRRVVDRSSRVVTETDTVRMGRTITKRDTVTETVPRKVIQYDTVRTTDTVRVPVPEGFTYMGAIEPQPLDITEGTATLTYFRGGRYVQNEYDLPTDRWGVGLRSGFTFAEWAQVTTTLGITRHAEWGPLDVQTRFGVGYGFLVGKKVRRSPVAQAGFRIGYDW